MAVITVVPTDRGVRDKLVIVATTGLLEVSVQAPDEVDVGVTRLTLATLSSVKEISVKVPKTGVSAVMVSVIDFVADFH